MNYQNTAQASNAYLSEQQVMPSAALERFASRLEKAAGYALDIGQRLEVHADRLHGECPKTATGAGGPTPVRCGAIGRIEELLDRLDEAHSFASEQANRNCSLA